MDPIPPIRPTSSYPAAVDAVRRIMRTGEDQAPDERRRPRREARKPAPADAAAPGAGADGHVDTRA
jgi:hypothetical protein